MVSLVQPGSRLGARSPSLSRCPNASTSAPVLRWIWATTSHVIEARVEALTAGSRASAVPEGGIGSHTSCSALERQLGSHRLRESERARQGSDHDVQLVDQACLVDMDEVTPLKVPVAHSCCEHACMVACIR